MKVFGKEIPNWLLGLCIVCCVAALSGGGYLLLKPTDENKVTNVVIPTDDGIITTPDVDTSSAQKCPAMTTLAFMDLIAFKSKVLYDSAKFTPFDGDTHPVTTELTFPCKYGTGTTMLKCQEGGMSWQIVRPCSGTKPGQPTITTTPGDQKLTIEFIPPAIN
eukprot:235368_1